MMSPQILSIIILTVCSFFICVQGHGMLCGPRQRGAYVAPEKCGYNVDIGVSNPVVDYCAHCLNGGTVATVKAHLPAEGWKEYEPLKDIKTARRAGLCGDPRTRVDHMIGGDFMPYPTVPIVNVSTAGRAIDFMVEIDTNHNGYFEFYVCNLDACGTTDIAESCFQNGHCYKLNRIAHPDCENPDVNTHYECGPIDQTYPGRWYVPCRNTGHVGIHLVGGPSGTMRYQLPDGLTCKHCVIQWYWATANSCNARGVKDYFANPSHPNPFGTSCPSDGGASGAHNPSLQPCGGDRVPEEFWSCSDIQISTDGNSLGVVQAQANPEVPEQSQDTGDEERVEEDMDEMIEEGKKQMEEDIEEEVEKPKKEEKKEEKQAEKGECILHDHVCDATVPCCDVSQVCVYTLKAGMFTCRFWWILWEEVEAQTKLRNSK